MTTYNHDSGLRDIQYEYPDIVDSLIDARFDLEARALILSGLESQLDKARELAKSATLLQRDLLPTSPAIQMTTEASNTRKNLGHDRATRITFMLSHAATRLNAGRVLTRRMFPEDNL